jgi:predicted O-methyltransferase YrrM
VKLLSEMAERGETYDMIFQDCGKYVYDVVYEEIFSLLRPGGLLFTDDTLLQFDPGVRKGLGMHVDRYNRRLFSDDRYYSTMLPVGQGIALSVRLPDGGGVS